MPDTTPQSVPPHYLLRPPDGLWYRVARATYLGFGAGGSSVLAAAIAFYWLVCLGPLGMLMAGVLERIFGPGGEAYRHLRVAVRELGGPATDQIMQQVSALLANPQSHVVNAVSLVLLAWSGLRLFEMIERILTTVWPGRRQRGYLLRKLMALAMMVVAGGMLAGFVLLTAILAVVRAALLRLPHVDPGAVASLRFPMALGAQFLLSGLAFTLVYKFVPVQKVSWRVATRGGLCAALLWQAASPLFLYTLARSQQESLLYGGLAWVIIFCLWALIGAWVLLVGAHFAAAYEHVIVKARPRAEDDALIAGPVADNN
jgi:membrane protein